MRTPWTLLCVAGMSLSFLACDGPDEGAENALSGASDRRDPGILSGATSGDALGECACAEEGGCADVAWTMGPCAEVHCDPESCACIVTPLPEATPCVDADPCTSGTKCDLGACVAETILECHDGNPCTEDTCSGSECVFPPRAGPCDDGDPCTKADTCVGIVCKGVVNPAGCPCLVDADCDSDGDPCTGSPACFLGRCVVSPPPVCDDGDVCTFDYCDPEIGCMRDPSPPCLVEDGNPCTDDRCDPLKGCLHVPLDAIACDDGLNCNGGDACVMGECVGTPCPCADDGDCENPWNPCTSATCDPGTGVCLATPVETACDDGNPCTEDTQCAGFTCPGGTSLCPDDFCCEPRSGPGCPNNVGVQMCTCHEDPFCCQVAWDALCVATAQALCGLVCPTTPGDCCATSVFAGCDVEACAQCVCAERPTCCAEGWDAECVAMSSSQCSASCGCAGGEGSCCHAQEGPGCADAGCEDCVCEEDPFCCFTQWDTVCAMKTVLGCAGMCGQCVYCGNGSCDAGEDCVGCAEDCGGCVGSCCSPQTSPGCSNATCQGCVCAEDTLCCQVVWDLDCVESAYSACAGPCSCPG